VEFVNPQIEDQQEKVARKHGFTLRRHRHELFGLCQRCQAGR
jgi:Fur family ferric uptake transcriptional regulator